MPLPQAGAPTIHQRVEETIGDEPFECAIFAEEQNTLSDSELRWRRFDAVHELPDQPLSGWERLLVFTNDYVYSWSANGYGHLRERTPRNPDAIEFES